ncbi:MAG: tRNA (guanosine(37)-N1)-methyltransferase TrmD [Candidatus Pacebacteria bacterium]|nr:tRNA (guanosine(37)-N1)-methyltransferase TrmD [Candidatus Paceibacterota bacterium]
MQFDVITIFPKMFDSYFNESILARAQKNELIQISVHDLRKYATDKHKTVDDTPYGGGVGMVLKIEPIYRILRDLKIIKKDGTKTRKTLKNTKVFLMSAKGKIYNQSLASEFSELNRVILICGRYEGVDERVAKYLVDEEISIGEYILTGGEIPAMAIIDSVSRLIDGVVGKKESVLDESFSKKGYLEYPHYTKPEIFLPNKKTSLSVPKILLSGNHKKIKKWREEHSKRV